MTDERLDLAEYLLDPFGTLLRARAEGWITHTELGSMVLHHADVRELLGDQRLHENFAEFLTQFGVDHGPFYDWMSLSPLNQDGDQHRAWRRFMSRTFTPRSVEVLRPYLAATADELVAGFAAEGACEFVSAFADIFPSLGMCELIGVPVDERETFREWANTIGIGFSPMLLAGRIDEVDAALVNLLDYTGQLVADRRTEPRDDLVSRIAQAVDADEDDDGFTDEQAAAFIAGLVFAGHETTKNQLGWMVSSLSERPDIWEAVADGTLDAPAVVEETLRHRSTVTTVGRRVSEDVEHRGETLPAGLTLGFSLWSADHDEQTFDHPGELDPAGNAGCPHLAFGHGAHHCLGAALARAELQEALRALTAQIGCPTVGDGAEWAPPMGITGPTTLPITFSGR